MFHEINYKYSIILSRDERYWGYCQCSPNDNDYDNNHKCCGHECDWDAPAFRVVKEMQVGNEESWSGDAHDYWKFENEFYQQSQSLSELKTQKEKEEKILYLQKNILSMQQELESLNK